MEQVYYVSKEWSAPDQNLTRELRGVCSKDYNVIRKN
jgi:hypothetical protein